MIRIVAAGASYVEAVSSTRTSGSSTGLVRNTLNSAARTHCAITARFARGFSRVISACAHAINARHHRLPVGMEITAKSITNGRRIMTGNTTDQRRIRKDCAYIVLVGIMLMVATIKPTTIAPSLVVLSLLSFMEYD